MPRSDASGTGMTRIAAWWKGDATPPADVPAEGTKPDGTSGIAAMRRSADRDMMDRITRFLCDHDLSPTPEHLLIARRHVTGDDRALSAAIDARIRDHGRITPEFLETLTAQQDADRLNPVMLAEIADRLHASLTDGCRTIGGACESARDYGAALDDEVRLAGKDPHGSIDRLVALTAAAIERSRQLAERLDETQRETNRLRRRLQAARRAAEKDHLTGLPNRRSFDTRLHAPAKPGEAATARCVALCDIDDFKRINDVHGHGAGDRVLRLVATHLGKSLGPGVMVARHGGEEFSCLFEGSTVHAAHQVLDAARDGLATRRLTDQDTGLVIGQVTFSAGIAPVGESARTAMRAADLALYAAKHAGKNQVIVAPRETTD